MRIETIGVKPNGILASWRYTYVNVSEDGIVTRENVPGKEVINLSRISDYANNDRRYANGQLITQFCNYTTHTLYRVYAMDETPFAYTQTDLNDPLCGYETVLPTPGIPYNPFGNPDYGDYATFEHCDIQVNIKKKGYTGSVSSIRAGGKSPVILQRSPLGDGEYIQKTTAKITFIQDENFDYQLLYTQDERMFQVEVLYDGQLMFKGYILPDYSNERFQWPANEVVINCTDGVTQLKEVTYPIPLGGTTAQRQTFRDVLCYCLNPLNLNLNLSTICNVYASTNRTGLNDDPLAMNKVSPLRFTDDKGTILKSYDVIEELCKLFNARFVQDTGEWVFFRQKELITGNTRKRTYDYTGLFLYAEEFQSSRVIGGSM